MPRLAPVTSEIVLIATCLPALIGRADPALVAAVNPIRPGMGMRYRGPGSPLRGAGWGFADCATLSQGRRQTQR